MPGRPQAEALGYKSGPISEATAEATERQQQSDGKGEKQIPFGNDKQEGPIQRFWLRQNDGI
jgi:hypothetical protein